MRGIVLALAAALSLLSTTEALDLVKRSAPAVVGFEIERKHVSNPLERDNIRRGWKRQQEQGDWVLQDLDNEVCRTIRIICLEYIQRANGVNWYV